MSDLFNSFFKDPENTSKIMKISTPNGDIVIDNEKVLTILAVGAAVATIVYAACKSK